MSAARVARPLPVTTVVVTLALGFVLLLTAPTAAAVDRVPGTATFRDGSSVSFDHIHTLTSAGPCSGPWTRWHCKDTRPQDVLTIEYEGVNRDVPFTSLCSFEVLSFQAEVNAATRSAKDGVYKAAVRVRTTTGSVVEHTYEKLASFTIEFQDALSGQVQTQPIYFLKDGTRDGHLQRVNFANPGCGG